MLSINSRAASPSNLSRRDTVSPHASQSNLRHSNHSSHLVSDQDVSTVSGAITPLQTRGEDDQEMEFEEPAGPPGLAPDCSACGTRLEYMRYVCSICGQGRMWLEDGERESATMGGSSSSGSGSMTTEWQPPQVSGSVEEQIAEALESPVGSPVHGTHQELDQIISPSETVTPHSNPFTHGLGRHKSAHGYELCPGCIEAHGVEHTRAMGSQGQGQDRSVSKRRRLGTMNHTYRELIWSATGWRDISTYCSGFTDHNADSKLDRV